MLCSQVLVSPRRRALSCCGLWLAAVCGYKGLADQAVVKIPIFFKHTEMLGEYVFILISGGIWSCFSFSTAADCDLPLAGV